MITRNLFFLFFNIIVFVLFSSPLKELFSLSLKSEVYSHIILVPLISAYFFYRKRGSIFSEIDYSYKFGTAIVLAGMVLYFIGLDRGFMLNQNDRLALEIFSGTSFWIGGFVLFYGTRAFRVATFPLLFLFFLTPIPSAVIEKFILILQIGSTEVTDLLFMLSITVIREGFDFHLPGLTIEVAKQCSGIRSSIVLVITSIVAGQLFLRAGWRKLIFVLSVFPITVFKNALRIVTLTLLGTYVDMRILDSELHRSGGIPFIVVGLALLAPVLWFLKKSEMRKERTEDIVRDKG